MLGAVLNANNTRLDASTIAYILDHGNAGVLPDTEFSELAAEAVTQSGRDRWSSTSKTAKVLAGRKSARLPMRHCWRKAIQISLFLSDNEWDALALNYTSGTTGCPGCCYSHRGAWTNAVNNVIT